MTLAAWALVGAGRPSPAGWRRLRHVCLDRGLAEEAPSTNGTAKFPSAPAPSRPPLAEVEDLWGRCRPVTVDDQVAAWLAARRVEPGRVENEELARALPEDMRVPAWARYGRTFWSRSGHRLLVPLVNAAGNVESVHARLVTAAAPGAAQKAGSPTGYEVRGLVMANQSARRGLGGEWVERWTVVEGTPDFLATATQGAPGDAVIGVMADSWSPEIAARIPDGATVEAVTHVDAAGERYAAAVMTSLASRCVVRRAAPPE